MTRYGNWVDGDPQRSGSRFSRLAAVAFVPNEQLEYDLHVGSTAGLAAAREEAVRRELGQWVLEGDEYGAPKLVDGSYGIGAEAWAVVLEWAAQGVIGAAAWGTTVALARYLRSFVARVRNEAAAEPSLSAGAACLLAIDLVLEGHPDEDGPLAIEAVEDASTVGGREPPTLSYGEEPWVVLLISKSSLFRYVVTVASDGAAGGVVRIPLGPRARHFIDDFFSAPR